MTFPHSFSKKFYFQFATSSILLAKTLVFTPVALGLPTPSFASTPSAPLIEISVSDSPSVKPVQTCSVTTELPQPATNAALPPPPPPVEGSMDLLPVPEELNSEPPPQLLNNPCPIGPTSPTLRDVNIRAMPENPVCTRPAQITIACVPW